MTPIPGLADNPTCLAHALAAGLDCAEIVKLSNLSVRNVQSRLRELREWIGIASASLPVALADQEGLSIEEP